jgi:hypothetical protein
MFTIIRSLALLLALASFARAAADPYPSHTLRNNQLSLLIYLPDPDRGFYRSTRFDWSGMIARADYNGHTFYALWKSPHNPLDTEDVIGPAEEFGMQKPLGFAEAKPGETFIKIGIGHLLKTDDPTYGFAKEYKIVKPADWQIEKAADFIQFHQILQDDRGYGYDYTKRIALLQDAPGFVIERTLKNTGNRPLSTNHYNHNFTMIDNEPINSAYRLTFAFPPVASTKETSRFQGQVEFQGNQMLITGPIARDKPLWGLLEGYKTVQDNVITIHNTKSGASVKIIGDYPLTRLAFYGASTAACPEPFTEFTLAPGQENRWQTRYILSTEPKP